MEDFKFRNNINAYFQTACLFILTITIFFSVPVKADFGWFEAGRHAMDGLFYYDLLLDWGLFSPVQYAQIYYQHYPAITPVMYPPFFGFCEAVGFALIGPYPWVARLTVIVFLLFDEVSVSREKFDPSTAVLETSMGFFVESFSTFLLRSFLAFSLCLNIKSPLF